MKLHVVICTAAEALATTAADGYAEVFSHCALTLDEKITIANAIK
jgi:hypothetical protein